MNRLRTLLALFTLLLPATLWAESDTTQLPTIIVSTMGSDELHRYTEANVAEELKRDFRLHHLAVSLTEDPIDSLSKRIYLTIGMRHYNFLISPSTPVARLRFNRNQRRFVGLGNNFLESTDARYTPPTFEGKSLEELPAEWITQINREIVDRTLLPVDAPAVFILELDIDEQGMVHSIKEVGGGLRQYAQVIIDELYEQAVRGWTPAGRNGFPYRSLAHLRFELVR